MPSDPNPISCVPSATSTPYTYNNFFTGTVAVNTTGDLVASAFPLAVRIGLPRVLSGPWGLVSLTWSSTLVNTAQTAGDIVFLGIGIDQGPALDLRNTQKLFLHHLSAQNSMAGALAASCRSQSVDMGQGTFFPVANQALAFYACSAPASTQNLLAAVCSYMLVPIPS